MYAMTTIRYLASTALVAAAFACSVPVLATAQAPAADDHAAHHIDTEKSSPPAAEKRTAPSAASMPAVPGASGNGMMMGGNMPQMAQMMRTMMMMQQGMGPAGMMPLGHVEGQIAFYKAELHITDAQLPQWNAFADALRGNAATLQAAMQEGMQMSGSAAAPEQMERRITMMSTQLDAMKAMLAVAKPLYAVLTDEQKKTADELMGEHLMGMRARGM
jgi:hypothetical protein